MLRGTIDAKRLISDETWGRLSIGAEESPGFVPLSSAPAYLCEASGQGALKPDTTNQKKGLYDRTVISIGSLRNDHERFTSEPAVRPK